MLKALQVQGALLAALVLFSFNHLYLAFPVPHHPSYFYNVTLVTGFRRLGISIDFSFLFWRLE